jgi:hypothetical protein
VTDVHKTLLVVTGVTLWQPHPGETQRRVMVPCGIKRFKAVHGDAALAKNRSVLELLASSGSSLLVQEFCPWWCCHSEAPICYQAPGFIYMATQSNLWWMDSLHQNHSEAVLVSASSWHVLFWVPPQEFSR